MQMKSTTNCDGGGRTRCAISEKDQDLTERCGKNSTLDPQREFSQSPAPFLGPAPNPHREGYLASHAQMQAWLTSHDGDQSVTPEQYRVARDLVTDLWCCTNVYAPHEVFTRAVVEGSRKFAELEAARRADGQG